MSWFQFILTYLVSWWLVLFMVLPWGVRTAAVPHVGHAPSAPERPRLARKFAITSVLALIPAFAIMLIADAQAASGIYHAGPKNGCPTGANVTATPGVKPATIDQEQQMKMAGAPVSIDESAQPYINGGHGNDAALDESYIHVGVAGVNEKGEATMNGQRIAAHDPTQPDCDH